jgi:hypothetical protein
LGRQTKSAEPWQVRQVDAYPGVLRLKEREIETNVMPHYDGIVETLPNICRDLTESRRVNHVRRGNTVNVGRTYVTPGVHERDEFLLKCAVRSKANDRHLHNSIYVEEQPRGFEVHDSERCFPEPR